MFWIGGWFSSSVWKLCQNCQGLWPHFSENSWFERIKLAGREGRRQKTELLSLLFCTLIIWAKLFGFCHQTEKFSRIWWLHSVLFQPAPSHFAFPPFATAIVRVKAPMSFNSMFTTFIFILTSWHTKVCCFSHLQQIDMPWAYQTHQDHSNGSSSPKHALFLHSFSCCY